MKNQKLFNIIDLTGNIFIIMAVIYAVIYSVNIMIEMKKQNQLLRQEVQIMKDAQMTYPCRHKVGTNGK